MAHLSIAKWQDSLDKVVLLDEGNLRGIAAPASNTEGDTNAEGPACIEYVDHHLGCIGDTVICICQRWRRAAKQPGVADIPSRYNRAPNPRRCSPYDSS